MLLIHLGLVIMFMAVDTGKTEIIASDMAICTQIPFSLM